jgi:hypothetical protein
VLKLSAEREPEPGAMPPPPSQATDVGDRTARPAGEPSAPGFFEQFSRTRGAFRRLIDAHFALLRAELGEILSDLRGLALLAAVALGLALLAANMLYIGGFLFVGEWLFGSMGWGLAHGLLLAVTLIVAIVLLMLGATVRPIVGSLVLAALLAVGMTVLLASNVVHDTAAYFGAQLAAPFNTGEALAAIVVAVVLGLLLALVLARVAGVVGLVGGLIGGAILGAIMGWVVGSTWTLPPAVGFAITIGFMAWAGLAVAFSFPGLDPGARFARLQPRQTIETVNETREWLAKEVQARRPKVGRR